MGLIYTRVRNSHAIQGPHIQCPQNIVNEVGLIEALPRRRSAPEVYRSPGPLFGTAAAECVFSTTARNRPTRPSTLRSRGVRLWLQPKVKELWRRAGMPNYSRVDWHRCCSRTPPTMLFCLWGAGSLGRSSPRGCTVQPNASRTCMTVLEAG